MVAAHVTCVRDSVTRFHRQDEIMTTNRGLKCERSYCLLQAVPSDKIVLL